MFELSTLQRPNVNFKIQTKGEDLLLIRYFFSLSLESASPWVGILEWTLGWAAPSERSHLLLSSCE